ncbi:MAG: OsmC family protein [Candidatus Marinimicrobia bacterium]|nr:OsmC family protein [Candidatus Neomarinimicrobiota bacterium]MCF7828818.1 OsmC family protein [Candidatus Neomarinimicrobiota bacterium]MCF7880735.1 OsmC family protein [Candidatus Neomarinimicrobiota bacterium]
MKSVTAQYVKNRTFIAKGKSNHWVAFDTGEQAGGGDAASAPMEAVLMALATCSGLDVIVILEKRRVQLEDLRIEVTGERADTHPKVFTNIHTKYIFTSPDLKEKDAEKAINLSHDKYCSVSAMLESTAEITSEYEIVRPDED